MGPKYPGCDCENCPMKNEGFVPPDGPEDSKILFIGQAPAYYEVKSGHPFSGPSGVLLDGALETVGLNRKDVRTDNSVLCFNKAGSGDPSRASVEACSGHITNAIEKADIIIPMGNSALGAVLGKEISGITHYSNTLFRHEEKIILPLIHPAFYLRQKNPEMFRDFLDGMSLLKEQVDGEDLWSDLVPEVKVFRTIEEVVPFLEDLRDNPPKTLAVIQKMIYMKRPFSRYGI